MKSKPAKKTQKEKLTVKCSIRFSDKEYNGLKARADAHGMDFSSYARDYLTHGRERNTAMKKKLCKTAVTFNNSLDKLYDKVMSAEGDFISKEEVLHSIEEIREECALK